MATNHKHVSVASIQKPYLRTPAKKSLQQASNTRPRDTGEAVGHDKNFGDEDYDSLDGIGEESVTDAEVQGRVTRLWLLIGE